MSREIELLSKLIQEQDEAKDEQPSEQQLKQLMELLRRTEERSYDFSILKENIDDYLQKEEFKVGDIVMWKSEELKNRKLPKLKEQAIIVEILEEAIFDNAEDRDSGSPFFHEPLDIRVAVIDSTGDISMYYYDSKRFQKIEN